MGQTPSKRASNASSNSLLTTYTSPPTSPSTPISPFYDVTPPAPPRELNRISEIIDPRDLMNDAPYHDTPTRPKPTSQHLKRPSTPKIGMVHSPSGNALGAEEFIRHPNRPLAMWERQERVVQATREGMERFEAESRMGNRSRLGTRSRMGGQKDWNEGKEGSKKRSCCRICPW